MTGTAVAIPTDGYLVLAGVPPLSGAGYARVRARIDLLGPTGGDGSTRRVVGSLWQDYARAAGQPMSVPNIPVLSGWAVRLVAAAASGWTTGAVTASVWVSDKPGPSASYIHNTPVGPGAGPGDIAATTITNPAAGANMASQAVGAQTVLRLQAYTGTFTADANAAGRYIDVQVLSAADAVIARAPTRRDIAALGVKNLAALRLGQHITDEDGNADDTGCPLPDILLQPGWKHQAIAASIQAGDAWTNIFYIDERWAVLL